MFILEGNIGAGKSTFLQLIKKHLPHIEIAFEPVVNWHNDAYGQSLLTHFYQHPTRWAYSLETFTMISRVHEHLQNQQHTNLHRIIERSIYSGYCFALNSYKNGFMNELEWQLYRQWFNFLIPQKCLPPKGFIYLQTQPSIALERIKKRERSGESTISLDYLQQIHEHHEQFLIDKKNIVPQLDKVPVLVLNCDEEFEADVQKLYVHLNAVETFINENATSKSFDNVSSCIV